MELESKLAEYRAKKRREAQINSIKEKVNKIFKWTKDNNKTEPENEKLIEKSSDDEDITPVTETDTVTATKIIENEEKQELSYFKIVLYAIGLSIWAVFYYIFIILQFGIIYLIISALFGIYFNTRTGPKDASEISAYSVFNKNCESIDGTLKAEQFEREIRFGAQSVR